MAFGRCSGRTSGIRIGHGICSGVEVSNGRMAQDCRSFAPVANVFSHDCTSGLARLGLSPRWTSSRVRRDSGRGDPGAQGVGGEPASRRSRE
jgi:hypothetical protein